MIDSYYLILELESEKTDQEALEAARTALTHMSVICLVQNERFRSPTIAGAAQRDPDSGKVSTTVLYVQLRGMVSIAGVGRPTIIEADGTVRPRIPTFAEQALRIVETNASLRTYGSVPHEWPGLYRVFETIKKGNNGKIPATWATDGEIDDFKQTANNPSEDPTSRHGFVAGKAVKPRMTIAQGRALIQKILSAWINDLNLRHEMIASGSPVNAR